MIEREEYRPPADAIRALAQCLYPAMVAYFESDEGKREFAQWQERRDTENLPDREAELALTVKRTA